MARIRTIKPEFPQSESMGRVSRDARLLFILLWPICDDHGRTRAASRMLASLLYPYDKDAGRLIDGWLAELEREGCLIRYEVDGSTYLEICKWLIHQKIDKPSKPQFPTPTHAFASPREDSRNVVVGREGKGREGKGEEGKRTGASPDGSRLPDDWKLPDDWRAWAVAERTDLDIDREAACFADYWHGIAGAKARKSDWLGTWRNWIRRANGTGFVVRGVARNEPALLPELAA